MCFFEVRVSVSELVVRCLKGPRKSEEPFVTFFFFGWSKTVGETKIWIQHLMIHIFEILSLVILMHLDPFMDLNGSKLGPMQLKTT